MYLQWKMEMSALIGGDYFPNKYNLCILPFSIYCPAGAVALLPENEVKICSPPKINFLHFTQRTPTNVFPQCNNQPGNYSTDICQICLLLIILKACFNALWNHHELELSFFWQADHNCQIYLLRIMSEKHNAQFSGIIFKIKKKLKVFVAWNHYESDHLASWLIFRLRCPPCLVGLVCVDCFK